MAERPVSSRTRTSAPPTRGTRNGGTAASRPTTAQRRDKRAAARRGVPTETPLVRRRGFWLAVGSVAVCIVLAFLALSAVNRGNSGTQTVAGVTNGQAPWPADPSGLSNRLDAAGLPVLTTEGEALHIHQHLDLFINGQHLAIPADIGIDQASGKLSPIHTHDATGVIHVESPTVTQFVLGQLFQVWGVPFSSSCIGTYCTGNGTQLNIWVNGQPYTGDAPTLPLQAHQEIVIAFGTPDQMPSPVPDTYDWTGL